MRKPVNMTRTEIEDRLAAIGKPARYFAPVGADSVETPGDFLRMLRNGLAVSEWERANPEVNREWSELTEQLIELRRVESDLARAKRKVSQ